MPVKTVSIVTAVRPDLGTWTDDYGTVTTYSAYVDRSCGHTSHLAAMPNRWPKVGDDGDCMTCACDAMEQRARDRRNARRRELYAIRKNDAA